MALNNGDIKQNGVITNLVALDSGIPKFGEESGEMLCELSKWKSEILRFSGVFLGGSSMHVF